MFLPNDDHLIVMNLPVEIKFPGAKGIPLTDAELSRIRDMGIGTVLNWIFWDAVEHDGWGHVDKMMSQARRLGFHNIVGMYQNPALKLPNDLYAQFEGGSLCKLVLSPWSAEAQARRRELYTDVITRYGGDDVNVVQCEFLSGECFIHNEPCYYDRDALASFEEEVGGKPVRDEPDTLEWIRRAAVRHFLETDGFLVDQHNEVWNALHPVISTQSLSNGVFAQEDILKAEREAWPDATIVLLQYTYWGHHDSDIRGENYIDMIARWQRTYNLDVIVEAMYCDGIGVTVPMAIERGFRGQVVAPLHPWKPYKRMEEWMFVELEKAQKLWEASDVS